MQLLQQEEESGRQTNGGKMELLKSFTALQKVATV